MSRLLCAAVLVTTACTSGQPPAAAPQELSLANLVYYAERDAQYIPSPNKDTAIPFSAVITPPGADIFYRSPPFTSTVVTNPDSGPRLNLLPGIVNGQFAPYVSVEIWTNNFGPVWDDPLYILVESDGQGGVKKGADGSALPYLTGPVYSTAPPDRFYSPFWRIQWVLIPTSDVDAVKASPLTSVKAVLDSGYPLLDGPLTTRAIVPADVTLDPPLLHAAGTTPTGFAPWMSAVLHADYADADLATMATPQLFPNFAWYEDKRISVMHMGLEDFRELPGQVVEANPIFLWVDRDPDGSLIPAKIPNVLGTGPLFANRPVDAPYGALPNWASLWNLYFIVRPVGSQPFYPQVRNPDDATETDVFLGIRTDRQAPLPSTDVSALPNVARYAGRLATNPKCFDATAAQLAGGPAAWAQTCGFLDSQQAIEAALPIGDLVKTPLQVLCQLQLWAEARP
jgi:hypothetical protein